MLERVSDVWVSDVTALAVSIQQKRQFLTEVWIEHKLTHCNVKGSRQQSREVKEESAWKPHFDRISCECWRVKKLHYDDNYKEGFQQAICTSFHCWNEWGLTTQRGKIINLWLFSIYSLKNKKTRTCTGTREKTQLIERMLVSKEAVIQHLTDRTDNSLSSSHWLTLPRLPNLPWSSETGDEVSASSSSSLVDQPSLSVSAPRRASPPLWWWWCKLMLWTHPPRRLNIRLPQVWSLLVNSPTETNMPRRVGCF